MKSKPVNVQISAELFEDLVYYFFADETERRASIEKALKEKASRLTAHEQYSKSKRTAP